MTEKQYRLNTIGTVQGGKHQTGDCSPAEVLFAHDNPVPLSLRHWTGECLLDQLTHGMYQSIGTTACRRHACRS